MTSRPTGMRSGFSVDTPDDYVLGSAKISYSFGPAVVQIFLTNSRQRIRLSPKGSRRILIIYFQLIHLIVEN